MEDDNEARARGLSRVPYGPPIHDAIASGDLHQMKVIAEAARRALDGKPAAQAHQEPLFERVRLGQEEEVAEALRALEKAIDRMERSKRSEKGR